MVVHDFSKELCENTVRDRKILSLQYLLNKLSSTQLDKSLICGVSNCLIGQGQRVVVNRVTSGWWPSNKWGFPGLDLRASIL